MVRYCSAYNCNQKDNPEDRERGISFHAFPKDAVLRSKWQQNVRREEWTPSSHSFLCSAHFEEKWFDRTGQTVRLKPGAIPTLFDFPAHLKAKEVKARTTQTSAAAAFVTSEDVSLAPSTSTTAPSTSEHSYSIQESPRKLKRDIVSLQEKMEGYTKKLKVTRQASRRLCEKVNCLEEVLSALKQEQMVSDSCITVLEKCMSGASLQLALRQLAKHKALPVSDKLYPPELRAFALTLNFYSAKAYNFVRETFDMCLPHPKTIAKWYRSVDGSAGFTDEALRAVQAHATTVGGNLICALVMDEMAIRQQVEWDGSRYVGFVDFGADVDDDCLPVAKEALVFMVVSVTERWKIPVGYFLIDGLNGDERANLLTTCLQKLYDASATVVSVTFDGCSANFSMVSKLGCVLNAETPTTFFSHPANAALDVCVILDPCHMLKLMRNLLAEKRVIYAGNGDAIKWEYIEQLEHLQSQEGLKAGTRLTQRHIQWTKQKMKVNIAAQTLSASVADALEFCRDDLGLESFADCAATVKFIRFIDRIFDFMNSRSPIAKGYKAPMKPANEGYWRPFVDEAKLYLRQLRLNTGTLVCDSNRKTGVIGFVTCLTSFPLLFDNLVAGIGALKYLLGYKFSQDHIELFFCAVRGRGGWNNNPTARHFKTAYKRLLVHQNVKAVATGNVVPQEPVDLLTVSSHIEAVQETVDAEATVEQQHRMDAVVETDHDYSDLPNFVHLSLYVDSVVVYIAGFVVRKVRTKLFCSECASVLIYSAGVTSDECEVSSGLYERKNRGGLIRPSGDVVTVCKLCERAFRTRFQSVCGRPPASDKLKMALLIEVLAYLTASDVFMCLHEHTVNTDPLNDHRVRLMRLICKQYFAVRLYHAGRVFTQKLQGAKVRSVLTKTIIFKGQ